MTDDVAAFIAARRCYHGAAECSRGCMCPCELCYLLCTEAYTGDAVDLRLEELEP